MKGWLTWQGKPTSQPSDRECWDSCLGNAREAAQEVARLDEQLRRIPEGDARRKSQNGKPSIRDEITRLRLEVDHWSRMARWYADRVQAGQKQTREPGQDG